MRSRFRFGALARHAMVLALFLLGFATASGGATLQLDFDTEPDGTPIPLAGIDPDPINDLFGYVGVELSWLEYPGNNHFCGSSNIPPRSEGVNVFAAPPQSQWGDDTQNGLSPCPPNVINGVVGTTRSAVNAALGNFVANFDRPLEKVCVGWFEGTQNAVAPFLDGYDVDGLLVIESVEDTPLCISGDDLALVESVQFSTQGGSVFFDDLEVVYAPELIDFDLDPYGHYVGDTNDVGGPPVINNTYASQGVDLRRWDGQSKCGESSWVPRVYSREVRAAPDIGSAANTVTLNDEGSEVPFNSSDGWIEANFRWHTPPEVCILASVDDASVGEGQLIAYNDSGIAIGNSTSSFTGGVAEAEMLCIEVADISCVRFSGLNDDVFFDDLLVEALPEPASSLLAGVALVAIAGLRRFASR